MTVIVAFLCSDGVVIASDSMLTSGLGDLAVGHHKSKKIHLLDGSQIFSSSGDYGLAARFRDIAHIGCGRISRGSALDYVVNVAQDVVVQFQSTGIWTGIWPDVELGALLAFPHIDKPYCCVFEDKAQPRLLDKHHFYVALGGGKQLADPFLRFLVEIFCPNAQLPRVRDAVFLATWTVEYVIQTSPGGVAGPTQLATLELIDGILHAREFSENDMEQHMEAIGSATDALRAWREGFRGGAASSNITPPFLSESAS